MLHSKGPSRDTNDGFILDRVISELITCPDVYAAFIEDSDIISVKTAFTDYAFHKKCTVKRCTLVGNKIVDHPDAFHYHHCARLHTGIEHMLMFVE